MRLIVEINKIRPSACVYMLKKTYFVYIKQYTFSIVYKNITQKNFHNMKNYYLYFFYLILPIFSFCEKINSIRLRKNIKYQR